VITQRTIAETVRLDRLALIAREAAEQTGRFDAPEIYEPVSLVKALDGWDETRPLVYADERGDDESVAWGGDKGSAKPILEALSAASADKIAVLIGPEGGFAPEERRLLRAQSFVVAVSLGPRILRAETAAIAALTIAQSIWGDWRRD
jgi:16S rRNA (uracil1498-N3)-methyltransferase